MGRERDRRVSLGRALRAGAGPATGLVRELFTDLGVFDGTRGTSGIWCTRRRSVCSSTAAGRKGSSPPVGPTTRDRDQMARFDDADRQMLRASGRFTLPWRPRTAEDRTAPPEDALSMAAWLDRERLDSPWLRWIVDYACRDDYGALSADVSAWAGLHYFAARDSRRPVR